MTSTESVLELVNVVYGQSPNDAAANGNDNDNSQQKGDCNLYDDVLQVSRYASEDQIRDAFMLRRQELYEILKNSSISSDSSNSVNVSVTLNSNDSDGRGTTSIWSMTERQFTEKKMDALNATFRFLSDAESRNKYNATLMPENTTVGTSQAISKNQTSAGTSNSNDSATTAATNEMGVQSEQEDQENRRRHKRHGRRKSRKSGSPKGVITSPFQESPVKSTTNDENIYTTTANTSSSESGKYQRKHLFNQLPASLSLSSYLHSHSTDADSDSKETTTTTKTATRSSPRKKDRTSSSSKKKKSKKNYQVVAMHSGEVTEKLSKQITASATPPSTPDAKVEKRNRKDRSSNRNNHDHDDDDDANKFTIDKTMLTNEQYKEKRRKQQRDNVERQKNMRKSQRRQSSKSSSIVTSSYPPKSGNTSVLTNQSVKKTSRLANPDYASDESSVPSDGDYTTTSKRKIIEKSKKSRSKSRSRSKSKSSKKEISTFQKISEEIRGSFEDTIMALDQVFNAFTIDDKDIDAITESIQDNITQASKEIDYKYQC